MLNEPACYLLPPHLLPSWLNYPTGLVNMVRAGRLHLVPWHLLSVDKAIPHSIQLHSRLRRTLFCFAHRQDCETLACFEKDGGEKVMIIHDNTAAGYENEGSFPTFADWLRDAETEAADWDK